MARGLKDGPEKIADVAKRCGITADLPNHPNPSIVLGAYEVSPLDMASAYATIANGGRRVEPTAITRVVSDEGQDDEKVLYEAPDHPEGEQVIPEDVAHEATEIMIGDVTEGIAKDASLGDRPVAGKTGTSENFFDAWFIGFTPALVTGTWMGYAEGGDTLEYVLDYASKLHGLPGGITPAMIWKTYTQQVLQGEPIEQFEGVAIPESKEKTGATDAEPGAANNVPGVRDRAPADRRAAVRHVARDAGRIGPPAQPRRAQLRRALRPPVCPGREKSVHAPPAGRLFAPGTRRPASRPPVLRRLASPRDSLRRHGDVPVAIHQVTPRQLGPARNADPGRLHDAVRPRHPPRWSGCQR